MKKNGEELFTELAKKSKTDSVRDTFFFLAGEESMHIEKFQNILRAYAVSDTIIESLPKDSDQISCMARNHVLAEEGSLKKIIKKAKTEIAAIDICIQFEKDSIAYFELMKEYIPSSEHYMLDAIIREERNHLEKLSDIRKNYA